jgi:hypothetical protein
MKTGVFLSDEDMRERERERERKREGERDEKGREVKVVAFHSSFICCALALFLDLEYSSH